MSTAGKPATIELSAIFLVTPLFAAILTLFPIVKCPEIPAWPPIITLSPIRVLPAIPVCAAIIAPWPIQTLWAICTKLSMKEFLFIFALSVLSSRRKDYKIYHLIAMSSSSALLYRLPLESKGKNFVIL